MSVTLYYSKINISSHILKIYNDKNVKNGIDKKILINVKDNISFTKEIIRLDSSGEEHIEELKYKFHAIEKFDSELDYTIVGKVIKDSTIFVSKYNEKTKQQIKVPTENSEVIDFFYDIKKEIVVFHTSNRFGYADFTNAFQELLNKSMEVEKEKYLFKVKLVREGLSLDKITKQLKEIGKIEKLTIEINPPNPDDELLDSIQKDGEKYLENIKKGNITQRSVLFASDAPEGLNIDASMIKEELSQISQIHSKLTAEEAQKKGYVYVGAINTSGRTFSTDDNVVVRDRIDTKPRNPKEFALMCKKKVSGILRSVF